jgi:hypothetical protein
MTFTDSDREAVLKALAEEQKAKAEGQRYSEAVLTACEIILRVNAPKHDYGLESANKMRESQRKQTPNSEIPEPQDYWWNRD